MTLETLATLVTLATPLYRYAVTELRKQANRMTFGELEEDLYQNDLGYTRGNIGKGGIGGGIRAAQVDERTLSN